MPTGMPGNIATGRLIEALDAALNDPNLDLPALRDALDPSSNTTKRLVSSDVNDSLVDLYVEPKYAPNDKGYWGQDKQHLRDHWLPSPGLVAHGGWWEDQQPVGRVLRAGLLHLVKLMLSDFRLVKTYWVCAGSHFEVVVGKSPQQYTMLLLTPAPPISRRRVASNLDEDIWVSKHYELRPGESKSTFGAEDVQHALTVRLKKPS